MAQLLSVRKVPPIQVEQIDYIDLRLTGDEADMLYDVLCKIGGHPGKSKRRHATTLFDTLREVYPARDCQTDSYLDGSIYFKKEL